MHSPDIVWTNAARELLYERLVDLFGAAEVWSTTYTPGRGLDAAFDQFCKDFAAAIGAKTDRAVKLQIRYAIHSPDALRDSRAQQIILNKAVAFKAGFIANKHLLTNGADDNEAASDFPETSKQAVPHEIQDQAT
jgi:hypothetical protein